MTTKQSLVPGNREQRLAITTAADAAAVAAAAAGSCISANQQSAEWRWATATAAAAAASLFTRRQSATFFAEHNVEVQTKHCLREMCRMEDVEISPA